MKFEINCSPVRTFHLRMFGDFGARFSEFIIFSIRGFEKISAFRPSILRKI
jgi:hypothetical protein